jgi:CheY-like chemotaxis protein
MTKVRDTILLVEDEDSLRAIVADRLVYYGFEVRTARDGHECLDAVRQAIPDLILLDLRIPGIDGWTVMARLRERWPSIPVVILSASSERDAAQKATAQGAAAYLLKPFEPDELKKTVFQALESIRKPPP